MFQNMFIIEPLPYAEGAADVPLPDRRPGSVTERTAGAAPATATATANNLRHGRAPQRQAAGYGRNARRTMRERSACSSGSC